MDKKSEKIESIENANSIKNNNWINSKWRPAMAWTYMAICIFDFIVAPILFTTAQYLSAGVTQQAIKQWDPLTMQVSGMFHFAMGAVIGITAWGRTKEKINDAISSPERNNSGT